MAVRFATDPNAQDKTAFVDPTAIPIYGAIDVSKDTFWSEIKSAGISAGWDESANDQFVIVPLANGLTPNIDISLGNSDGFAGNLKSQVDSDLMQAFRGVTLSNDTPLISIDPTGLVSND